jgi:hypothetical protein
MVVTSQIIGTSNDRKINIQNVIKKIPAPESYREREFKNRRLALKN